MSENNFYTELKKIGIELSELQKIQFQKYVEFLLEYNSHTNLTAIREKNDVYLKHFYDSLILLKNFKLDNERVLDIGCGAGFPGVVLKIAVPSITLVCLDSNGKKTKFLEELKEQLKIEYDVINDRAENYVKRTRESFDIVTSRAVTNLPVLAELSIPFVKVDGYFIPYKGILDESLENGEYAILELGGKVEKVYKEVLPYEKSIRTFIIVRKKCKTKDEYPRLFDKINKKPLQNTLK